MNRNFNSKLKTFLIFILIVGILHAIALLLALISIVLYIYLSNLIIFTLNLDIIIRILDVKNHTVGDLFDEDNIVFLLILGNIVSFIMFFFENTFFIKKLNEFEPFVLMFFIFSIVILNNFLFIPINYLVLKFF